MEIRLVPLHWWNVWGNFWNLTFITSHHPPHLPNSSHPTHRYIIENPVDVEGAKRKKGKGKAGDISEEGGKGKERGDWTSEMNC